MSTIRNLYRKALVVVAATATLAAMASVTGSTAARAATPNTVVTGSHRCNNFGAERSGYQAGQCIDLNIDDLAGPRVQGLGQSFCQTVVAPRQTVGCEGIKQVITISFYGIQSGISGSAPVTYVCGTYGGRACPASVSFENLGFSFGRDCATNYFATIQTTLVLPVSGAVETSSPLETEWNFC